MPRLVDLDPKFIRYETKIEPYNVVDGDPDTWRERGCPVKEVIGPRHYMPYVESVSEAQGIMFLCPKCYQENLDKISPEMRSVKDGIEGAGIGVHSIQVSFADRGVTDDEGSHDSKGKPSRWTVTGDSFENLSTQPSILLAGPGCGWHGYITNGIAE